MLFNRCQWTHPRHFLGRLCFPVWTWTAGPMNNHMLKRPVMMPFGTEWTMIVWMMWLFLERHNLYWAWETQAAGQKRFLGSVLVFDLTGDHFQSSQQCRVPVLWSSRWSSGERTCSTQWVPTCSWVTESARKPQGSGVCWSWGLSSASDSSNYPDSPL